MTQEKHEAPADETRAPKRNSTAPSGNQNFNSEVALSLQEAEEAIYYPYVDREGEPLHRQVRNPGKQFFQERWDPDGECWRRGLKGVRTVPYRLPEVLAGIKAGRTIYVVEGEKDADNLRATGRIATCNPGGTGMGWKPHLTPYFKGAVVVIIQDKDGAGHTHALSS